MGRVARLKAFQHRCRWPGCLADSLVEVPLCWVHVLMVSEYVQETLTDQVSHLVVKPRPRIDTEGTVYFLRFDQRIKIGWTSNLAQRLADVPHDEVLLTMPGTMTDEKRCHAAFAHLRETGEWFRADPDLLAFIDDLRGRVA